MLQIMQILLNSANSLYCCQSFSVDSVQIQGDVMLRRVQVFYLPKLVMHHFDKVGYIICVICNADPVMFSSN